jgi:hypothetical protein
MLELTAINYNNRVNIPEHFETKIQPNEIVYKLQRNVNRTTCDTLLSYWMAQQPHKTRLNKSAAYLCPVLRQR